MAAEEFTHSELDSFLRELTSDAPALEPHTSDDPFYLAQQRQKELEVLQGFDQVPLIGRENENEIVPTSVIVGQTAQHEVNKLIPAGLRSKRLAISTFLLVILESKSQKWIPYTDDEEVLVSGLFNEFDFDKDGKPKSLIVPLFQPRILKPRILHDLEIDKVTIPILNINDWELDLTTT